METRLDAHLVAKTEGAPNQEQVYVNGRMRITVIAPELLRVEFDARSGFLDEATQSIWYRDLGKYPFSLEFSDKHVIVKTECAVYYINRKKERIDYVEIGGKKVNADNKDNLFGTYRTLDMTHGAIKLGLGVVGKGGVAVLEDNSLILGKDGECKVREKEKDLYCFATTEPQKALDLFYKITGAPPMVPRYALGNWWSRYYAYTQKEYLDLMSKFQERDIPLTVATIDMDWHWVDVKNKFGFKSFKDSYVCQRGWTGYSWNTDLFPDYKAFLKELKEDKNLRITVNLHPASGVRSFENQYEEMCKAMDVPANGEPVRFDCADPKYLNAYFKVLHKPYERDGVDFWWIDWQQGKWSKIPGLDPLWACNHYHTLDSAANGKRPLILSRYAGLGSHRYPLGFSGDVNIVWSALRFQPYFTYTASNVGYTHWSHDMGGHNFGNPKDDQLYLRWVQFGIFSPIMRLHSTKNSLSKEPWNHKSVEEETIAALRFRHALIPYIYTAYYNNYSRSVPICKPLYYDYKEEEALKVENQYLFGDSLMVCPITSKWGKDGVATREVWLPEGIWTDIFTGEVLGGGKHVVKRDKKSIPVFAKQGAIIPFAETEGNFSGNPENLKLNVYNVGDGEFTLYEDDGETENYKNNVSAFTRFKLENDVFTVYPVEGELSLVPEKRNYKVCFEYDIDEVEVKLNGEKTVATVDGNTVILKEVKPTDKVEIRINL